MAQKTGALIFDEQTDRYDIRFDIADYYGGLHCGESVSYTHLDVYKRQQDHLPYLIGNRFDDQHQNDNRQYHQTG